MISDDLGDKRVREGLFVRGIGGLVLFLGVFFAFSGTFAASETGPAASVCAVRQEAWQALNVSQTGLRASVDDACVREGGLNGEQSDLERTVTATLAGSPMMVMAPFIAKQDKQVAAFLVGIAKKESDWGFHAPTLDGKDCYNYWGYKGQGRRGTALGYACFETAEEAVLTVGGRLQQLVVFGHRSTPADMIVWKCGSSCAGHSPESVSSWINTVSSYYDKIIQGKQMSR